MAINYDRILSILKIDLQICVNHYDTLLQGFIMTAEEALAREGVDLSEETQEDEMLVEQYAAWLARKRKDNTSMSRMLRWQINNRIFQDKVK